jgi:hypothetical protein
VRLFFSPISSSLNHPFVFTLYLYIYSCLMTSTEIHSKLYDALQQREIPPRPLPSKSYQPRRRRPSLAPTPSRTPSMSLHRRQPTKPPVTDFKVLPRLEEENANLPPQVSRTTQLKGPLTHSPLPSIFHLVNRIHSGSNRTTERNAR